MTEQTKHQNLILTGGPSPLTMMAAIDAAKHAIGSMTGQKIDAIVACARAEGGDWTVSIDVIESFARIGDNDLLTTYQTLIGPDADLQTFTRTRRYYREDQER